MDVPTHGNRVSLFEVVEGVAVEAAVDAHAGGFGLAVAPVPRGVHVEGDPQALAAAVTRLVHSAFEHSRTHGHVSLTTTATADHVLIEVEDECGGLSPAEAEARILPLDEGGRCVEAMGGQIRVRALPGQGCVVTVDLPRQTA